MMRHLRIAVVVALATAGFADTLTLKNGQVVNGTYLGGSAREVRMDLGDQIQTYAVSDIVRIEFSAPPPQPAPSPQSTTSPEPPAPAPPAPVLGVALPSGTNFVIRMIDAVDSQTASPGQNFAASLDQPINDANGNLLIPRGADVVVKLVEAKQSGKITGRTELALELAQVRVNGQLEDVFTQTVTKTSGDRTSRSEKTIGGGALGGLILGGALGGGKGAAIGAGAGAAAGTGVELTTKGQRVRVPSETRLTFVLDTAVKI